jgi:hypothetical protein
MQALPPKPRYLPLIFTILIAGGGIDTIIATMAGGTDGRRWTADGGRQTADGRVTQSLVMNGNRAWQNTQRKAAVRRLSSAVRRLTSSAKKNRHHFF